MAGEFDEDEKIEERIGKLNLIGGGNYEGQVKDGMPNGHGKTIWDNGNYYQGRYAEGKPKGEASGKLQIGNSLYDGTLRDGKPDGKGKAWKDKAMYEGGFKMGKWHGFGTKMYKDGD